MENQLCRIEPVGSAECLFRYTVKASGRSFEMGPPAFQVDGRARPAALSDLQETAAPVELANAAVQHVWRGRFADEPDLSLELTARLAPDSPVVRFRYRLSAARPMTLTKTAGCDDLLYLTLPLADMPACKEVRLSEFDRSIHSYRPTEQAAPARAFEAGLKIMGPLLLAGGGGHTLLAAYEHGSQAPDAFLAYHLAADRSAALRAVKGNYWAGLALDAPGGYESIWLHLAAVAGEEDALARCYRQFLLRHLTLNAASRRPYVFYNTWCFQERNRWWNGRTFIESMNERRMLDEIDVAARMGIDVFVLDTGWYEKTGDWRVSSERFPRGLGPIRDRLDAHGMKLGLWFSPTEAAPTSRIFGAHGDCRLVRDGRLGPPHEVWETEPSYSMCLVSRYWEAFADELIRLVKELGVTYFKWDAVGQYGCNEPAHLHGGPGNSPRERADCYAFEQVRYMARVIDKLCSVCPEAIVDFDVTEGGRSVGLAFLAAGKYFLINNGPYYGCFDHPREAPTSRIWSNVFVYPGPARPRVCRPTLDYDRWVPSVLLLTHYLPDDPRGSQLVNLASLVLGHNGIWGDLLSLSDEGVALFGEVLGLYKQVRDDITDSFPVRTGIVGASPEVHEKISERTGRGVVAVFSDTPGRYAYVTANASAETHWATEGVDVSPGPGGRARLDIAFDQPGAKIVLFGVRP